MVQRYHNRICGFLPDRIEIRTEAIQVFYERSLPAIPAGRGGQDNNQAKGAGGVTIRIAGLSVQKSVIMNWLIKSH